MINKKYIETNATEPFYLVEHILERNKEYYLSKEEIYSFVPTDENNVPLITISSIENTLRALCRARVIDAVYVRGVRHFAYKENRDERNNTSW